MLNFKRFSHFLCVVVGAITLTHCATLSQPATPMTWPERVQTMQNLNTWHVQGMLAIRMQQPTPHAETANVDWQQNGQDYKILLFGPLGAGAMTLQGRPGAVTLQTSDGKTWAAKSPQALLARTTGWVLPVENLLYWIRGIPVPKSPATRQLDAEQRLQTLTQADWQIQYLHYTVVQGIALPDKLLLSNTQFTVKIVVNHWEFTTSH